MLLNKVSCRNITSRSDLVSKSLTSFSNYHVQKHLDTEGQNFKGLNRVLLHLPKYKPKHLAFSTQIITSYTNDGKKPRNSFLLANVPHSQYFSSSTLICQKHDTNIPNDSEKNDVDIGSGTWKEVYSGVLTTQLKLLKMFSIGSSIIGLSMQPILYEKLGTANLTIVVTLASFLGFFTFVTPALIHWVSKKYVTKLEYDPQNDVYAATTLSFFLREKKIQFKIADVTRPEIPGIFTSFLVKKQALFVDPETFKDIDHYSRIMGFDKPIDFSWDRDKKR